MKIAVLVKQVNGEINPFDACALEAALQTDAQITIISMGRLSAKPMLENLSRLGNIIPILISDTDFAGSDTLATSKILCRVLQKLSPDLIFCGRQSVDGDTAQVPVCLSQLLKASLITRIMSIDNISDSLVYATTRNGEKAAHFPAVLTFERINTLRLPSIRSKIKPVEIITNDELKMDKNEIGLFGSPTRVVKTYESTRGRRKCKFILPSQLNNIISDALKMQQNTADFFKDNSKSESKLPVIYCVGEEAAKMAKTVAEKIKIIAKVDFDDIIEIIKREKAEIVLWDSGVFGRENAPRAAAVLNCGLCADCVHLSTDGSELFFYRPALSGAVTAKIICKGKSKDGQMLPKMATIHTVSDDCCDVMLSLGLGAVCKKDELIQYAKQNGWAIGASRGAVDCGDMPYFAQIGLTGKAVAPKVYIACGISGAVHHTCAIENAGTVIAINSDKNARIFDYADYGIVMDINDFANIQK